RGRARHGVRGERRGHRAHHPRAPDVAGGGAGSRARRRQAQHQHLTRPEASRLRPRRDHFFGSSFFASGFAAGPVGAAAAGWSFTISSSSTSNWSVEPGLIFGGAPRSPYATSAGQMSFALPPGFIWATPSVQHLITWFSGKVAGCPRSTELSKTVPSMSLPV